MNWDFYDPEPVMERYVTSITDIDCEFNIFKIWLRGNAFSVTCSEEVGVGHYLLFFFWKCTNNIDGCFCCFRGCRVVGLLVSTKMKQTQ